MSQQYFYDQQIRRWLLQFMRLFGGFSVKMGKDANGNDVYHQVPVRYGDTNRMSAHILRKNSENTILSVPAISCYIAELVPNADRRMTPTHQENVQIYEKAFDPNSNSYQDAIGETYTLERHAPIPFDLTLNVDIWTSNTEQKLQLLEQILLLFNPSVNLQSSQNPYDWTSLAVVELVNITWTARSIPQGTDDIIDVASLIFSLPIFLTPPAKVKRQVLIHSILNNVGANYGFIDDLVINESNMQSRQWITFEDRHIRVAEDYIQLLNRDNTALDHTSGNNLSWKEHFTKFGGINNGITEIRLKLGDPLDPMEVIVKVSEVPDNENVLSYVLDTSSLPNDTITMVNGIIDPTRNSPGNGSIPEAQAGQRYIITNSIIQNGTWGNVAADENDIIEYNGSTWIVSFDASAINSSAYTTNANTMKKLFFTGSDWVLAVEGVFEQGWWRIVN
ncbi:Myoviridae tail sheath stabiliser [uncultured Caudovirales phage]|uniref:Myoviridae tail sheath stabiliser n=1 Tax=uncultured Caudovirales phage TaxID=2100421 RepID=A0A6J5T9D6_9CAUD|nr:Myoviridae tail sheath stabiliser [uncultured Caudovirales phage]